MFTMQVRINNEMDKGFFSAALLTSAFCMPRSGTLIIKYTKSAENVLRQFSGRDNGWATRAAALRPAVGL